MSTQSSTLVRRKSIGRSLETRGVARCRDESITESKSDRAIHRISRCIQLEECVVEESISVSRQRRSN